MTMRALRWAAVIASISFASLSRADCPTSAQVEAITLSNEADKARAVDLDAAISGHERAFATDPKNAAIGWKLALDYQKKEDWAKLASTCATVSKLSPSLGAAHRLRGFALVQLADKGQAVSLSEAKQEFTAAIAADPNLADAHEDLGDVLERQGDDAGALDHYTKAIMLSPPTQLYYVRLADLYSRLGFGDQAIAVAREGVSWGPSFALSMLWAQVLEERHDDVGALTKYGEAKAACGACTGREALVHFALGASLARQRPPRKAEALSELSTFFKMICKGGAAARYADQCSQSMAIESSLGSPP